MDGLYKDIRDALPERLDSSKNVQKVEQSIRTSLKALQDQQSDDKCFLLLKSGIMYLIKVMHLLTRSVPVEFNNSILNLILDCLVAASEQGSKSNSFLVSAITHQCLDIVLNDKFGFLSRIEVLNKLNLIFESTAVAVKEKFVQTEACRLKLKKLFQLVVDVGDYEFQVCVLEFLFRLLPRKLRQQYSRNFIKDSSILQAFLSVKDSCFEVDCRKFLNHLNGSQKENRKVYSFPCQRVTFASVELQKPCDEGYDDFWLDLNLGSKRIIIFCENAQLSSQMSSSEDCWETVSVWQGDVHKFACQEEQGQLHAKVCVKATASCVPRSWNKDSRPILHVIVDAKHRLEAALVELCSQAKASDVADPLHCFTDNPNQEDQFSEDSGDGEKVMDEEEESINSGKQSAKVTFREARSCSSESRSFRVSEPSELMATPASTVTLTFSPVSKGSRENTRRSGSMHTPQARTSRSKKKVKTPVVTVQMPVTKSSGSNTRKAVKTKFIPPPIQNIDSENPVRSTEQMDEEEPAEGSPQNIVIPDSLPFPSQAIVHPAQQIQGNSRKTRAKTSDSGISVNDENQHKHSVSLKLGKSSKVQRSKSSEKLLAGSSKEDVKEPGRMLRSSQNKVLISDSSSSDKGSVPSQKNDERRSANRRIPKLSQKSASQKNSQGGRCDVYSETEDADKLPSSFEEFKVPKHKKFQNATAKKIATVSQSKENITDSQKSGGRSKSKGEVSANSTDDEKLQRSGRDDTRTKRHAGNILKDLTNSQKEKKPVSLDSQQFPLSFSDQAHTESATVRNKNSATGHCSGANEDDDTEEQPQLPIRIESSQSAREDTVETCTGYRSTKRSDKSHRKRHKSRDSTKETTSEHKTMPDTNVSFGYCPEVQEISTSERLDSTTECGEKLPSKNETESDETSNCKRPEKDKLHSLRSKQELDTLQSRPRKKQDRCQSTESAVDKEAKKTGMYTNYTEKGIQRNTQTKKSGHSHNRRAEEANRGECDNIPNNHLAQAHTSSGKGERKKTPSLGNNTDTDTMNYSFEIEVDDKIKDQFDQHSKGKKTTNDEPSISDHKQAVCVSENSVKKKVDRTETEPPRFDKKKVDRTETEPPRFDKKKVDRTETEPPRFDKKKVDRTETEPPRFDKKKVDRTETEPPRFDKSQGRQLSEKSRKSKVFEKAGNDQLQPSETRGERESFHNKQLSSEDADQIEAFSTEVSADCKSEDEDTTDFRFDFDTPRETPLKPHVPAPTTESLHCEKKGLKGKQETKVAERTTKCTFQLENEDTDKPRVDNDKHGLSNQYNHSQKSLEKTKASEDCHQKLQEKNEKLQSNQETVKSNKESLTLPTANQKKQTDDNSVPPSRNLRKRHPKSYKEPDESVEDLEINDNLRKRQVQSRSISDRKLVFTKAEQRMSANQKSFVQKTFTMSVSSTHERTHTKSIVADPYSFDEDCESTKLMSTSSSQAHSSKKGNQSKIRWKSMPRSRSFSWDEDDDNDADAEGSQENETENSRRNSYQSYSSRKNSLLPLKFLTPDPNFPRSDDSQDQTSPHRLFFSQQKISKQRAVGALLDSATTDKTTKQRQQKQVIKADPVARERPKDRKKRTPATESMHNLSDTETVGDAKSELSWIKKYKSGARPDPTMKKTYKKKTVNPYSPESTFSQAFSLNKSCSEAESVSSSPERQTVAVTPRHRSKKMYSPLDITVGSTPDVVCGAGDISDNLMRSSIKSKTSIRSALMHRASFGGSATSKRSFQSLINRSMASTKSFMGDMNCDSDVELDMMIQEKTRGSTVSESSAQHSKTQAVDRASVQHPQESSSSKVSRTRQPKQLQVEAESSPSPSCSPLRTAHGKAAPVKRSNKAARKFHQGHEEEEEDRENDEMRSLKEMGLISGPSTIIRPSKSVLKRRFGDCSGLESEEEEEEMEEEGDSWSAKRKCLQPRELFPDQLDNVSGPSVLGPVQGDSYRKRKRQPSNKLSPRRNAKGKPKTPKTRPSEVTSVEFTEEEELLMVEMPAPSISTDERMSQPEVELGVEQPVTGVATLLKGFGFDLQKQIKEREHQVQELAKGALKLSNKRINQFWSTDRQKREEVLNNFRDRILSELSVLEEDVAGLNNIEHKAEAFYLQQLKMLHDQREKLQRRVRSVKGCHEDFRIESDQAEGQSLESQKCLEMQMKKDMERMRTKMLLDMQQQQLRRVKESLKKHFI